LGWEKRAYEINVKIRRKEAERKKMIMIPELEDYFLLEDFGVGIFQEKAKFVEKILLIRDIIKTYQGTKNGS